MTQIEEIKYLLRQCSREQRYAVFRYLRDEFPIHKIETQLHVEAEVILEAIARSSDLVRRGIRGVIAEAAFDTYVVRASTSWIAQTIVGDQSFDYLLSDPQGSFRVQVKMQRLKQGRPMTARQALARFPETMFVVEAQRTRGGKDLSSGESTRPYRFGEFDILAVSLHPSTRNWSSFMFTVANWLLPDPGNDRHILKFQPVSSVPSQTWTGSFEESVQWLRSGEQRSLL